MTWTPERVALAILVALFAVAMLVQLAAARERRHQREQRCDFCSWTGTRHDRCRCTEDCGSVRCEWDRQRGGLRRAA